VDVGGKVDVIVISEPEFVTVGINTNEPDVVGDGRELVVGGRELVVEIEDVVVVMYELSGESDICNNIIRCETDGRNIDTNHQQGSQDQC
jgi:hypothetical protein